MKDYVMNEIEKLFNNNDYPFVTITANGETLGNYCTQRYQDIERLFEDMCRHELTIKNPRNQGVSRFQSGEELVNSVGK